MDTTTTSIEARRSDRSRLARGFGLLTSVPFTAAMVIVREAWEEAGIFGLREGEPSNEFVVVHGNEALPFALRLQEIERATWNAPKAILPLREPAQQLVERWFSPGLSARVPSRPHGSRRNPNGATERGAACQFEVA